MAGKGANPLSTSDAYAKMIVAGRFYAKKEQLLFWKVVPKGTYDKIKDMR
jgi:competence protein ComEA